VRTRSTSRIAFALVAVVIAAGAAWLFASDPTILVATRPRAPSPASSAPTDPSPSPPTVLLGNALPQLWVRGTVRRPDGEPAGGCRIWAYASTVPPDSRATTDASGTFQLGPFDPEEIELLAEADDGSCLAETTAMAGSDNVVVQLVPTGGMAGTVVDEDGVPIQAGSKVVSPGYTQSGDLFEGGEVLATSPRFPHRSASIPVDDKGNFEISGLGVGSYDVAARLPDGRVGLVRSVVVDGNRVTSGVRVEVRPGCRLSLVWFGTLPTAECRVLRDGAVVRHESLERSRPQTFAVPAGELVLELWDGRERLRRSVSVPQGGETSLLVP
jgi:hypothetical protein